LTIPHDISNGDFMNSNLPIGITFFHAMADNQAKSTSQLWPEVAAMLSAPHASALSHKSNLPLFSPWVYKPATDPTVVNGDDGKGKPLKFFSSTHVRRISENLVEMTILVLDYDGGRPLNQLREIFNKWEHVAYTTLNHREEGKDKARIVLPLAASMPVADFKHLAEVIKAWATDLGADPSTADIGRMFIMPAVRKEDRHLAQSWHHEGEFLDWRMFSEMPTPVAPPTTLPAAKPLNSHGQLRKLLPDVVIETPNGHIVVRDITHKISNVRCPFHDDPEPSEFVNITGRGTPFLVCKKCGTVYMERAKSDGIADGIADILARKKLREGGAQW
jgi:hypothetical protein